MIEFAAVLFAPVVITLVLAGVLKLAEDAAAFIDG